MHFDLITKKNKSDKPKADFSILEEKSEIEQLRFELLNSKNEIKLLKELVKKLRPDENKKHETETSIKNSSIENNKIDAHICRECGQQFSNVINMEAHVRQEHTKTRPFQCTSCRKIYSTRENLWSHIAEYHKK